MATPKVGGEVDAFCTKCRLTLGHTILAMLGAKIARVRCNTCQGDHAYRSAPGARASSTSATRAPRKRAEKIIIAFEEQLAGKDLTQARTYSPKHIYTPGEVINHPTFGMGIVAVIRHDKVDVTFKMTEKTLIHARGEGAAAARPTFAPPHSTSSGPSDKPMSGEVLEEADEAAGQDAEAP